MIGSALGWALMLGMTALGLAACAFPLPVSDLYGAPQRDRVGAAWVRAAGLRDLGLSLALAAFLASGARGAAGMVALSTALVALGDFSSVFALRGRAAALPLAVHFSGIAVGLGAAALLGIR